MMKDWYVEIYLHIRWLEKKNKLRWTWKHSFYKQDENVVIRYLYRG